MLDFKAATACFHPNAHRPQGACAKTFDARLRTIYVFMINSPLRLDLFINNFSTSIPNKIPPRKGREL